MATPSGPPVTLIAAGGLPVTHVDSGAPVFTEVAAGGMPVTLVDAGGFPVTLSGGVVVGAPNAFTIGMWTLEEAGIPDTLHATILSLPSLNGGTLEDIEYRLDGGSALSTGLTGVGEFFPTGLAETLEVLVEIRAVTDLGEGAWSDVKFVPDPVAPTITSPNSGTCASDVTLLHALTASKTVTWSITGGADASKYEISGSTLRWTGNGTKDFDAPDDVGLNNTYVVDVRATDFSSNTADQTITITVLAHSDLWFQPDGASYWLLPNGADRWKLPA